MSTQDIDAAARHGDFLKYEPWHGLAPDEAMMLREDGGDVHSRRAEVQELLFAFLLADGLAEWRKVAARACGLMRQLCPAMMVGRAVPEWLVAGTFPADEVVARLRQDGAVVRRLMEFYFPGGRNWLRDGVARVVLVARVWQPELVMVPKENGDGRRVPGFEDFAVIFGEMLPSAAARERGLARSRWSARAQEVLRKPIERSGGTLPALFGKSSMVREKYRAAAAGNTNRRKS